MNKKTDKNYLLVCIHIKKLCKKIVKKKKKKDGGGEWRENGGN